MVIRCGRSASALTNRRAYGYTTEYNEEEEAEAAWADLEAVEHGAPRVPRQPRRVQVRSRDTQRGREIERGREGEG